MNTKRRRSTSRLAWLLAAALAVVLLRSFSHREPERPPQGEAPDAAAALAADYLTPLGPDAWRSPAGLVYRGRDPEGRTRLEHVLRHARDVPDRAGPHGVFDGGAGGALRTIDAAWRRATKEAIRPQRERGRDLYLVPMGRRIGYLGGRLGAARGHPPLRRVLLVLETGTTNVVTAYPK